MPLTKKGKSIMRSMKDTYGDKKGDFRERLQIEPEKAHPGEVSHAQETDMPWTADEFRQKHCRDLTNAQAKKASSIANAMLRSGTEDGVAIATGIKKARELASKVPMYARLNGLLRE